MLTNLPVLCRGPNFTSMYFPRINAYLESLFEALSRTEKRTVQEMVEVCRTPLVKNCSSPALADNHVDTDLDSEQGEDCRTVYESECWTKETLQNCLIIAIIASKMQTMFHSNEITRLHVVRMTLLKLLSCLARAARGRNTDTVSAPRMSSRSRISSLGR